MSNTVGYGMANDLFQQLPFWLVTRSAKAYIEGMTLREFLTQHNISHDQFAAEVGAAHRITVHRWTDGSRIPSREYMRKIVSATAGQVQPADFYEEYL